MALTNKIKHIDTLANGVLRFRRRFPKEVGEALDKEFLQVHIRNTQGLAFHREYQAIIGGFDRIVAETRERLGGVDMRSPTERWHEALLKAEGLIAETTGLNDDDDFIGRMIAKDIADRPETDPLLIKALVNPKADAPEVTVQDAANLYAQDKGLTNKSDSIVRLERTLRRLKEAIGPLDQLPLNCIKREHGRKLMKVLLGLKKADGSPVALGTAQRDATIVSALIAHGLKEFDLSAEVANPFASLPWPKDEVADQKLNKKLPLSDELIERVSVRLRGGRTEELPLMWRLLKGTGMRLGEAAGLTQNDLVLNDETPHVLVRPNSVRGLKTASSNRSVPLTGDAMEAAKEALEGVSGGQPIFPRYARKRGADAASAALMKAIRSETKEKKLTVHGLRHRVSDKLLIAPDGVRHGFLGHAPESIAESTYGSPRARLEEFAKWAVKAGL